MNYIQKLERLRNIFWSLRRKWGWALLSLAVAIGLIWLSNTLPDKNSVIYKIVLGVSIVAVAYFLLWISSFFIVNTIKKKLTYYYTNGLPNATKSEEKIQFSFSRLLSLSERITAYSNFKELRDISDYCFLGGPPSYVRIQWEPSVDTFNEPKELVKSWPESNEIPIPFTCNNETVQITVVRECSDKGERVFICQTPLNPTREERIAAEKIQLLLNEPCVVAYGWLFENSDGSKTACDEILCTITWIGGNR